MHLTFDQNYFLLLSGSNSSRWTFFPNSNLPIFFVDFFYFFDAIIEKGLIYATLERLSFSLSLKRKIETLDNLRMKIFSVDRKKKIRREICFR